jgi:hypothetical protein
MHKAGLEVLGLKARQLVGGCVYTLRDLTIEEPEIEGILRHI